MPTVIDTLFESFSEQIAYLDANKQATMRSNAEENFKRVLVVATASFFESELKDTIKEFVNKNTGREELKVLINTKLLDRGFFRLIELNHSNRTSNSLNSFLATFGMKQIDDEKKTDEKLEGALQAFVEIMLDRDILVHQNYASRALPGTTGDYYDKYKRALYFISYFKQKLGVAHASNSEQPACE